MRLGVLGGTNAGIDLIDAVGRTVVTAHGEVATTVGRVAETEVVFILRHGKAHELLASSIAHKANIRALADLEVDAIVGTTVCGIIDPDVPLGTAILFDDLLFPDNRLPDGTPCTFFAEPGDPARAHLIWDEPFSEAMRAQVRECARRLGIELLEAGTYAYMLGPRFNTRAEVRSLAACGAVAVSQSAGPEAVLAAELEIPYCLVGFGVDYANGVSAEPTAVTELDEHIRESRRVLSALLARLAEDFVPPRFDTGFVYRIEG